MSLGITTGENAGKTNVLEIRQNTPLEPDLTYLAVRTWSRQESSEYWNTSSALEPAARSKVSAPARGRASETFAGQGNWGRNQQGTTSRVWAIQQVLDHDAGFDLYGPCRASTMDWSNLLAVGHAGNDGGHSSGSWSREYYWDLGLNK